MCSSFAPRASRKKKRALSGVNVLKEIPEMKVYFDNKLISIGNSKNVLKNPLNSIVWLLNNLSKNDLKKLNNLYVSTGTCTPAIKMRGYSNFKAFFGSIGSVELSFF